MRKLTQSAFNVLVLAMLLGATIQAAAAGTITFNGELAQNTCDVSIGGQGASGTVVLPTVQTSLLQSPGQTAGKQRFSIYFSGCSSLQGQVAAFFEAGPTVDPITGRLKNTDSTGATNVSLQLLNTMQNNNPIQAGNQNQIANNDYVIIYNTVTLAYDVQYYAEGNTTPGLVNSSVVYSLMYK
ncbi:fimbrial protein [Pantoea sp.]|uniref:fimbrial protein n=1 Tax=Pantoea sp. TaxID=69393 RepID=UPI0031D6268E